MSVLLSFQAKPRGCLTVTLGGTNPTVEPLVDTALGGTNPTVEPLVDTALREDIAPTGRADPVAIGNLANAINALVERGSTHGRRTVWPYAQMPINLVFMRPLNLLMKYG